MCPDDFSTPEGIRVEPPRDERSDVASVIQFTVPVFRETPTCNYIEFYAFDPYQGRLRRKRIKTNRIKGVGKQRKYAQGVIKRITDQLNHGWNPWIAKDTSGLYVFSDVLDRFETHISKMLESGYYRKETYNGYKSYLKILRQYAKKATPL